MNVNYISNTTTQISVLQAMAATRQRLEETVTGYLFRLKMSECQEDRLGLLNRMNHLFAEHPELVSLATEVTDLDLL